MNGERSHDVLAGRSASHQDGKGNRGEKGLPSRRTPGEDFEPVPISPSSRLVQTALREFLSHGDQTGLEKDVALAAPRAYFDRHKKMLLIPCPVEEKPDPDEVRAPMDNPPENGFAGILGQSHSMQELVAFVRSIAEKDVTVLIQGETGTGKELIARAIHTNSTRHARRYMAVNCGSLTETLLESELFGHERGAFTGATGQRKGIFEVANGGTLFLDEIGEIPPSTQVKLLRVLQEGEFQRVGGTEIIKVDARILAATNQDLEILIKQGRFRQDLFYRLNVVPITVPPLRERADDIPVIAAHLIEKCNRKMDTAVRGISPQALAMLTAYRWPGNVRELENVIQRMIVVARGERLDVTDLPPEIRGKEADAPGKAKDLKGIARGSTEVVEKHTILDALTKTAGNVTQAARSLGISRVTLQKKMKLYNLRDPLREDLLR